MFDTDAILIKRKKKYKIQIMQKSMKNLSQNPKSYFYSRKAQYAWHFSARP